MVVVVGSAYDSSIPVLCTLCRRVAGNERVGENKERIIACRRRALGAILKASSVAGQKSNEIAEIFKNIFGHARVKGIFPFFVHIRIVYVYRYTLYS